METIENTVEIIVELLDEGTVTWRPTNAIDLGNGLFKILATPDYDSEDEAWAFLPGDEIALEKKNFSNGKSYLAARHPDPNVISIDVPLINNGLRPTKALNLGDGKYKILPTPHYDSVQERWEFPPGSIVYLEKRSFGDGFSYLVPKKLAEG